MFYVAGFLRRLAITMTTMTTPIIAPILEPDMIDSLIVALKNKTHDKRGHSIYYQRQDLFKNLIKFRDDISV